MAVGHYARLWGNNGPFRLPACCKDTINAVADYCKTKRTKNNKIVQVKINFMSIIEHVECGDN